VKKRLFVYVLPTALFLLGCLLHYSRGYYYTGLTSIHAEGADDAYISYRYGWNLAQAGTLSWNESGYRRTEGFTNPLWVYLSAALALPGHKEWVYPAAVIVSSLAVLGLLLALIQRVYKDNAENPAAVIGLVLIAAAPVLWLHTTSGLESGVFGAAAALLAYLALFGKPSRRHDLAIFLLALLVGWLRSDGFVYLGILLAAAWIAGSPSWKPLAAGMLLSTTLLLAWRRVEFGAWLPNTAVAKVNFDLLKRVQIGSVWLLFAMLTSGLLTLAVLGMASLALYPRRIAIGGTIICTLWVSYYIFIGGDHFAERHLLGLLIFLAALSAPLWRKSNRIITAALILCVVGTILLSFSRDYGRFDYASPKKPDPWILLGRALQNDRSSYGVVITTPAGKIPFYAGGDFIDALGLNDPVLATYQRPEFVPGHSSGDDLQAIEIAKTHPSQIYSYFTFLDPQVISSPEAIRLWVDNRQPQESVQPTPSEAEWQAALAWDDTFRWSIISQPVTEK
jgi:hypothetical protein